ncbi:MAG: SIS domain-containing protein [Anaerolineae bacterium]|nr:SIS domain-containing protein [Anaerolineae bacterium]
MSRLEYAQRYFEAVLTLQRQALEQQAALAAAAEIMVEAARNGGRILIFGSGHSHLLAEEGHYRAGGLACVVPILHTSLMLHEGAVLSTVAERQTGIAAALLARYQPCERDCLVVISNSGVNAVPVEMAQAARQHGMKVIAILALAYAQQVPANMHGVKLMDVADVVLDNQGQIGDALVALDNAPTKVGPSSTVIGAFLLNGLLVEVAARLARDAKDAPLPVYISANVPNAAEHNLKLVEQWRKYNPHL